MAALCTKSSLNESHFIRGREVHQRNISLGHKRYRRWDGKGREAGCKAVSVSSAAFAESHGDVSYLELEQQNNHIQGMARMPLSKALLTSLKWMLAKPPHLRLRSPLLDLQKCHSWVACTSTLSTPSAAITNTVQQALLSNYLVGRRWVESWPLAFYVLLTLAWSQKTVVIMFIHHYSDHKRRNLCRRNRKKNLDPWQSRSLQQQWLP